MMKNVSIEKMNRTRSKGGEMMAVIRDTVLLPGFQYIIKQLDREPTDSVINSIDKLLEGCVIPEVKHIFTSIRDWFSKYQNNKEDAQKSLEHMIDNPKQCRQCFNCYNCFQIFLIELYERYYDNRFDELKNKLKNNNYYVFNRLPENIYRQLDTRVKVGEYYWERCKEQTRTKAFVNKLVVLKGMSSSTPAILNGAFDTQAYHGGGLYINWDGYGIAIDPGYHFVENMHRSGLNILDINAVIVTHEHIDHTNDIRILDDLNFSLSGYLKEENEQHIIKWYLDSVTYDLVKTLQKRGSGFSKCTSEVYKIVPESREIIREQGVGEEIRECFSENGIQLYHKDNCSIIMKVEPTFHEKDESVSTKDVICYLPHTFATVFEVTDDLVDRKIFYSSDTRYQKELSDIAVNSDVVIANISSIYENDLLRLKLKNTHLGYMGCFKLLEALKGNPPALFLLSEFWNAKADIRFDVARYLKEEILRLDKEAFTGTKIIPAEIGMQADLRSLAIQCTVCGKFTNDYIIIRPEDQYSEIKCICRDCCY